MRNLKFILVLGAVGIVGCGGNDPLTMFGDPSVTPVLVMPMATTPISIVAFHNPTTAADGLLFNVPAVNTSVKAPAAGTVRDVTTDTGSINLTTVSLLVNVHYTLKISRLASTQFRVGDRVDAGQEIGISNSQINVSLLQDGTAICPWAYFDATSMNLINTGLGGTRSCLP